MLLQQRINGRNPLFTLRGEMDRLFQEMFEGVAPGGAGVFGAPQFPPVNVWEDNTNLFVEAELPGLRIKDLEVYVRDGELTIRGRRNEVEPEGVSFHRRELGRGEFGRVFKLPIPVEADAVEAKLRDGVLTVRLPKAQSVLPRKIEVKS